MRISNLTRLTGFAVVLASLAVVAVSAASWDGIKIGGKQYGRLIDNKDLTADILPPPLYVLESYAHALDAETPADAVVASNRIRSLKADFEARLDYWEKRDLDPRLKALLFDQARPAASKFWTVALDRYLPAVKSADAQAITAARHELKAAYMAQRAVVDAMVPLAAESTKTGEEAAASGVMWTQVIVGALMLLLALLAVVNIVIVTRRVAGPLANMKDFMLRLADGDLSQRPPYQGRRDEVGEMARAVQVFRQNAIDLQTSTGERVALERETAAERSRTETERQKLAQEQQAVLNALGASLARLAQADVTARLEGLPEGYGALQTDFNRAIDVLRATLVEVSDVVQRFTVGTDQIAEASDDLSRRTEHQAASLEQTAAALDELTATVKTSSAGAGEAASLVAAARQEAGASREVVEMAVGAMSAIERSSSEISQIIGVIDEIAFQTNLLALNAGVEAARAGDAGRGFAVVASEVRALAQRSASAAKEIKVLIQASSTQVLDGVRLVGQTGESLQRIVERVSEIDGLVADIALAAKEQATGIHEVNLAVNQMDQVTQSNAAMVEQSTAATQSLRADAADLSRTVARFNLGRSGPRLAPPGAPQRPVATPVGTARERVRTYVTARGGARPADDGWDSF